MKIKGVAATRDSNGSLRVHPSGTRTLERDNSVNR